MSLKYCITTTSNRTELSLLGFKLELSKFFSFVYKIFYFYSNKVSNKIKLWSEVYKPQLFFIDTRWVAKFRIFL